VIETETVFVLGAGASAPYGFPTGIQLRQRLCEQLRSGHPINELLRTCKQEKSRIRQLHEQFERSGVASIDSFIAFRPEFQEIGELAIAAALIPLENREALTRVEGRQGNGGWYQMLWNELLAGLSDQKDLSRNRVRFITFNYDRSLEQYLHDAISSTFGIEPGQAQEELAKLPIQHVYGSLGGYVPNVGYRYGGHQGDELAGAILNAARSIKTVPAARGPTDEVSVNWLATAERVFVMGFGFDPTNCDRVNLKGACSQAKRQQSPRPIFANAFHLTTAEMRWCEVNSCPQGRGGLIWTNGDCVSLFRDRKEHLN
jgi:hypothetical protein